mmetsp:Transcript_82906/g.257824  ORF Transcript_82906/g.257824 Transcript_82906/m.257824 type:complete len:206 (-) Transcript_82906:809-1426(-)
MSQPSASAALARSHSPRCADVRTVRPSFSVARTGAPKSGRACSSTELARTRKLQKKGSSAPISAKPAAAAGARSWAPRRSPATSSTRAATSSCIQSWRVQCPLAAQARRLASAGAAPMSRSTAAARRLWQAEARVFMVQRTIVWMPPLPSSSSSRAAFRQGMYLPSYISAQPECAQASGSAMMLRWLRASLRKWKSSELRSCASR